MSNIIFQAKTVQTSNIKTLFEVLKKVLTDINLVITNKKIKIVSLNNTEISLIHVKMDADKFESYYCEKDEDNPLILGVNTDILYRVMKTVKHDETISFYMTEEDSENMYIKKENEERNTYTVYTVELYQVEHRQISIPNIEYDTNITMYSAEFQKICKDYSSLGARYLEIKNANNQLFLSADGDNCKGESVYGGSNNTKIIKNNGGDSIIQGKYNLEYLLLFSKAKDLSSSMDIYIKNEYPIILSYKIGTLGELKFIVSVVED